jgi:glycosyltransferase involved in cell wall biosynthesis
MFDGRGLLDEAPGYWGETVNDLTIIIPFFNGHDTIGPLLAGLPQQLPVIIVDDLSERPLTPDDLPKKRPSDVRIIRLDEKGYFSGAVNFGILACRTDVLVLNQDVTLEGTAWLNVLSEKHQFSLMGDGVFGHPAWPMGYVQGTFMFMRRDALEQVGLLNAEQYPLWGATCEWQLRACRQGFYAYPMKEIPGFAHKRGQQPYGSGIRQLLQMEPEKREWLIQTPPMVSVIVSCYNYGRYLPDLIASLIGGESSLGTMKPQTFQSFEVVIVDDASQDETPAIIRSLIDPWKGIRSIRLPAAVHPDGMPNNGTPLANNAGIEASYGRYISILGGDDMMEHTRLGRMVQALEANPHSVIYDDMQMFAHGRLGQVMQMRDYSFDDLLQRNHIHAGIMFPRQAYVDTGGYPVAMRYGREDWAFNVALGVHGYCGVHLDYPGYLYRREEQGRSTRNTNPSWMSRFAEQMRRLFPRIYAGERPMACCGQRSVSLPAGSGAKGIDMNSINNLVGQKGMTLVEYHGSNAGTQTWHSPITNARYVFGGKRKVGFVDNRDLQWITTTFWEGNKPLFRIAPQQPSAAELVVDPGEAGAVNPPAPGGSVIGDADLNPPAAETAVPDAPVEVVETAVVAAPFDPKALNITDLKKQLGSQPYSVVQLSAVLAVENADSPRSGAVSAIEAAIAAAGG